MPKEGAHQVSFQAYGLTDEGYGVLVFTLPGGKSLPLALAPAEWPAFMTAVVTTAAHVGKQPGRRAPAPAIPVQSWSTHLEDDAVVLTLQFADGGELRYALTTRATSRPPSH